MKFVGVIGLMFIPSTFKEFMEGAVTTVFVKLNKGNDQKLMQSSYMCHPQN